MMSVAGLALTASCLLLGWRFLRVSRAKGQEVGRFNLVLGCVLPPLVILACLFSAQQGGRMDELRLGLCTGPECVQTLRLAEGDAFTVGEDRRADDIVVSDLGPAALRVSNTDPAAPLGLTLAARAPKAGLPATIASTGPSKAPDFIGVLEMRPGDAVCLTRCGGADADWFVLRQGWLSAEGRFVPGVVQDGRVVAEKGAQAQSPMKTRKVLKFLSGLTFWGAHQAVHPLRYALATGAGENGERGCGFDLYCVSRGGRSAESDSFVFRRGGVRWKGGGQWRLALRDPGARLAPRGVVAQAVAAPALTHAPEGNRAHVRIWAVRMGAPDSAAATETSRLSERRSFVLRKTGAGDVTVAFDTPETLVLGGCEADDVYATQSIGEPELSLDESVNFRSLGGGLSQAVQGTAPLPKHCRRFHGAVVTMGDLAIEDRQAQLRLDHLNFPLPMAIIALLWAGACLRLQWTLAPRQRVVWILVSLLQMLLALRWLFGLAGGFSDPATDWRALVGEAGVAYVTLPALMLLTIAPVKGERPLWVMFGIFLAACGAALWLWTGGFGALYKLLFLAAIGGVAWRTTWSLIDPAANRGKPAPLAALLRRSVDSGRTLTRGLWTFVRRVLARPAPDWAPWCLVGALALRLALIVFGVKERVFGMAVSAFYTPLIILGLAVLLQRAQAATGSQGWRLFWAYLVWSAVLVVLLPFGVSDMGYALVMAGPVFALPLAAALPRLKSGKKPAAALEESGSDKRLALAWTAPAAGYALLFVVLALLSLSTLGGISDKALASAAESDQAALTLLRDQSEQSANDMRLKAIAMPEDVRALGTRTGESQSAWSAHLSHYTSSLFGRGYLSRSRISPQLMPVQMTDNLAAIQLMSPFGRISAGALLLLLASAGLACAASIRRGGKVWTAPQIAGLFALWTIFGTAAYMILANLQLVLFTGRNIYLLASDSGSDLVEGAILFALALWGLRSRREAV